jgi:hypothetical protein
MKNLTEQPMKIRTNHQPRDFLDVVTVKDRARFDYLPADDDTGFFRYKGTVYHLSQFIRYPDPYWTGVYNSSMTTGVLVRILTDGRFVVGTYRE